MIKQSIQDAFGTHTTFEIYSSHLYLSMSAWFETKGLSGFAHWLRVQYQEENLHALRFFDYVLQRDGTISVGAIDAPPTEWESPLAAFKETYAHECMVTERINKLVDLVLAERDHASNVFMQWFVTEQVEEEATVKAVIDKLELVKDDGRGLLMLDQEMAQRTLGVPPPA